MVRKLAGDRDVTIVLHIGVLWSNGHGQVLSATQRLPIGLMAACCWNRLGCTGATSIRCYFAASAKGHKLFTRQLHS